MHIEQMHAGHWPQVAAIYSEGISTGQATFETSVPEWEEWDAEHVSGLRFVAIAENGRVAGWSAMSPVSDRCTYAGVGEVSVYVAPEFAGQGVGQRLLEQLISESERAGFWTLQAGIFPENMASLKLHEKCGFRVVGIREKPGKLNGEWKDVIFLERRSSVTGID